MRTWRYRWIFPVSALVLLLLVALTASMGASGATDSIPSTQALNEREVTLSAPPSLEGTVTGPPSFIGGYLVLGTTAGVYVFEDDELLHRLDTPPVHAIRAVDDDSAMILVEDEYFPNILLVDLATGDLRWSMGNPIDVYNPEIGYVTRQQPAFDATPIDDVSGSGETDVVVSTGKSLIALDGKSGTPLWEVDHSAHVWRVVHDDGTVYAGTQDGILLAIDSMTGEQRYTSPLAEVFEHIEVGSVPRAVWDIEVVTHDGDPAIAVTTEDGRALLVDPDSGSILWEERLVTFDDQLLVDYYRGGQADASPSIPGDSNFFNLKLEPVDAETVTIVVDIDRRLGGREYPRTVYEIHHLDTDTGTIGWSTDGVALADVGNVRYGPQIDDGRLMIPHAPRNDQQRLTLLGIDDGRSDALEIDAIPAGDEGDRGDRGYVAVGHDRLAIASSDGDLLVTDFDGSVRWSFAAIGGADIRSADFLGMGDTAHLVYSHERIDHVTQTRTLVVRDGYDGSVVWSRSLSIEEFTTGGGYAFLDVVTSATGSADIVALQRPRERQDTVDAVPAVVVISGKDGSERFRHDLVVREGDDFVNAWPGEVIHPTGLTVVGDISGDGYDDVLVSTWDRAFIIELRSGDIVWQRVYHGGEDVDRSLVWEWAEGKDYTFVAVGGDTDGPVEALLGIATHEGEVIVMHPTASGSQLEFSRITGTSLGGDVDGDSFRMLDDITGDGYSEVLFAIHSADEVYAVFAPGEGRIIATFADPWDTVVTPSSGDFAGDGSGGIVATEFHGGTSIVTIHDGRDVVLTHEYGDAWFVRDLGIRQVIPAAAVGDLTGDGRDEIAVVESSPRRGARVAIYEPTTGTEIDTIVLETWADGQDRPLPGLFAEPIRDQTGDGFPLLGVAALTDGTARPQITYFIVDPATGSVQLSLDTLPTTVLELTPGLGVLSDDGQIHVIDATEGVTLDASVLDDEVAMQWSFDTDESYVTTVYINDRPVAVTTDRSHAVRMPPGTHEVQIRATAPTGVTVFDTVEVEVTGGSVHDIILYGLGAIGLGIMLLPAIARRVRR